MESHRNRNILTIMQWQNKQFERSSSYARQPTLKLLHRSDGSLLKRKLLNKSHLSETSETHANTFNYGSHQNKILIDKMEHQRCRSWHKRRRNTPTQSEAKRDGRCHENTMFLFIRNNVLSVPTTDQYIHEMGIIICLALLLFTQSFIFGGCVWRQIHRSTTSKYPNEIGANSCVCMLHIATSAHINYSSLE